MKKMVSVVCALCLISLPVFAGSESNCKDGKGEEDLKKSRNISLSVEAMLLKDVIAFLLMKVYDTSEIQPDIEGRVTLIVQDVSKKWLLENLLKLNGLKREVVGNTVKVIRNPDPGQERAYWESLEKLDTKVFSEKAARGFVAGRLGNAVLLELPNGKLRFFKVDPLDERLCEVVIRKAEEGDTSSKTVAIVMLGSLKRQGAADYLSKLIMDHSAKDDLRQYFRLVAIKAAAESHEPGFADALVSVIRSGEGSGLTGSAIEALSSLGKLNGRNSIDALIAALRTAEDISTRSFVTKALSSLKLSEADIQEVLSALLAKNETYDFSDFAEKFQFDKEKQVDLLIPKLKDKNYVGREHVCMALADLKSKRAVEGLMEVMREEFSQFAEKDLYPPPENDLYRSLTFALGESTDQALLGPREWLGWWELNKDKEEFKQ